MCHRFVSTLSDMYEKAIKSGTNVVNYVPEDRVKKAAVYKCGTFKIFFTHLLLCLLSQP